MKDTFEHIIKNHLWRDTVCGSGSTMDYTSPLRAALPAFLEKHNIQSMFDAPCGDYSWMSHVQLPDSVKYYGGDIVGFMVDKNREQHPGVDFRVVDISSDELPAVDLLFCRDCLFHFSTEDIKKTIANIARSSVKYILTTSFDASYYDNRDIKTGDFRNLSLEKEPFNLPAPIDSIDDYVPGEPIRRMCLWSVDSLKAVA